MIIVRKKVQATLSFATNFFITYLSLTGAPAIRAPIFAIKAQSQSKGGRTACRPGRLCFPLTSA